MMGILYSYLLQQKSLSIPGLGTIYIDRVPARTDIANRQLLPPFYSYRFDKYFDAPDKDFFTYFAVEEGIADYEAIRLYNEWAYQLSTSIRNNQPVEIERIGVLKRDGSGEIVFEPHSAGNSLLLPVPANKVIRSDAEHRLIVGDREITHNFNAEYPVVESRPEKASWWIYALIAAAIVLVLLFFHFTKGGGLASVGNQQLIH